MEIVDNYVSIDIDEVKIFENENQIFRDDCAQNTLSEIDLLYNSVIENFRTGNDKIFNPYLFSNLTIDKFRNWITTNNPEIGKILM